MVTMTITVVSVSRYSSVHLYRKKFSICQNKQNKQTPWPESASELYPLSDSCLSAKLMSTFVDRGCCVVSVTDPYGRILAFLDRSRYVSSKVAPQLYSRGHTHYFSENLVAKGIKPGPLDL
jgi:hypothetical protein